MSFQRLTILLVALLLTNNGLANPFSAKTGYGTISNVIFHSCYDGDTCTFTLPGLHPVIGDKVKVRLAGIDTPEIRGKCEQERKRAKVAKLRLNNILKTAKKIEIRNIDRGKYFRIVAEIWVDGRNVNQVLINENLAVRYFGRKKVADWCKQ